MATTALPPTMRTWKYGSAAGRLENDLKLHASETLPKAGSDQHLIKVLALSLNPVDFKPAEAPLVGRFAVKYPMEDAVEASRRLKTGRRQER